MNLILESWTVLSLLLCYFSLTLMSFLHVCDHWTSSSVRHKNYSQFKNMYTYLSYVNNRNFHISTICKKIKNHLWNAKTTATKCVLKPTVKGFGGKRALPVGILLKSELCQKRSKFRMQFYLGALNNVMYVFLLQFALL